MSRKGDDRRFERLAEMQRVARDQRYQELAQSCEATDASAAAEASSQAEQEAAASALEAIFGAPHLCVDRFALAVRQFHATEAALAQARQSSKQARDVEDDARLGLHQADYRARLISGIARRLQRKRAEKRQSAAILQTTAVNIEWRGRS